MASVYLPTIAANMKSAAERNTSGRAWHKLKRGLYLVYVKKDATRRLSIGRVAPLQPSLDEADIVMRDFGVPAGTELIRRQVTNRAHVTFNVIDMTWREVVQ